MSDAKHDDKAAPAAGPRLRREEGHHGHGPNYKEYFAIFAALAILTALEIGVVKVAIGRTAMIVTLIGLALVKAALVALYYMHLKHETKIMKLTVAIPLSFPALYAVVLIAEGMSRHP